ncbi:MAG TPA: enoyl-CoA hydratase/isomerase family protein [Acidimicrobiia bacterium]|nr:enoyl-CoA hydratase/isomerase family protein [Acidimicrobiia bacterium]
MSVHTQDRDGIKVVLLDRPERRNAIDMTTVVDLRRALESASEAVVVLGSTDPRSFSSGADLSVSNDARAAVSKGLYELYEQMRAVKQIIVAAASGHAVGGGAQLLLASDIRIAGPDLKIRFVGPGHGLVVGAWGLASLVGRGRAMDLCLSMRPVDAAEALAIGLVDRVVADPLQGAIEYARMVSELDPKTLPAIKRIVATASIGDALGLERKHNSGWDGDIPNRGRTE